MRRILSLTLIAFFTTILIGIAKPRQSPYKSNRYKQDMSDSIYNALRRLGVRYPEVATAQARLETANFTSRLFRQDNNVFGIKKRYVKGKHAQVRYAHYNSISESCEDYAAYYKRRIEKNINSREDYLKLLKNYSQTHNYISLIRNIVRRSAYTTKTLD